MTYQFPESIMQKNAYQIFQRGSKTYFFSSLFFPNSVRDEVAILYSFVRRADDFVDCIPQQRDQFTRYRRQWEHSWEEGGGEDALVLKFVELAKQRGIARAWVDAFLDAMAADLDHQPIQTIEELESYIYGSAEVVGLMMCRLMNLSSDAHTAARQLGKSMQLINFIRDVAEDNTLGRRYLPTDELKQFALEELTQESFYTNPNRFRRFIRFQIQRYRTWQAEAEAGFHHLPRRLRIPVQTASTMYNWTADQIDKTPEIVLEKKIKPAWSRVLLTGLKHSLIG